MTAAYLACLALGYLIGSLSVSILISKYIFHQDVRTLGSGNAGAANALKNTRQSIISATAAAVATAFPPLKPK